MNTDQILLDEKDRKALYGIKMHIDSKGYPTIYVDGKKIRLHQWLMQPQNGQVVDHINRIKIDCRRSNLRICSLAQNARNTGIRNNNRSGFKGVYFCKQTGKWRAEIRINGQGKKLGRFPTKIQAAIEYDRAAEKLHGSYAITNFQLGLLPEHWSKMTDHRGRTIGGCD